MMALLEEMHHWGAGAEFLTSLYFWLTFWASSLHVKTDPSLLLQPPRLYLLSYFPTIKDQILLDP